MRSRRLIGLPISDGELGLGYEALEQIFRRMVFNVLTGEFDDHTGDSPRTTHVRFHFGLLQICPQ